MTDDGEVDRLQAEAVALGRQGRWSESRQLHEQLFRLRPCASRLVAIGETFLPAHQFHEALACFIEAEVMRPYLASVRQYIVQTACRMGEPGVALRRLDRWIAVRDDPELRALREIVAREFAVFDVRVWHEPQELSSDEFLRRLADIESAMARRHFADAENRLVELARSIPLQRREPEVLGRIHDAASRLGLWAEAEQAARALIAIAPTTASLSRLASALFSQEKFDQASESFARADAQAGGDIVLRLKRLLCLMQAGRHAEVVDLALAWNSQEPDARLLQAATLNLVYLRREAEAGELLEQARARYPDNRYLNRIAARHELMSGDFARGFRDYLDRWLQNPEDDPAAGIPCPAWDGAPFTGTLLVLAEQALGEEIMVSSTYSRLLACQPDCVVEADPRLIPLLERSFTELRFMSRGNALSLLQGGEAQRQFRKVDAGDLYHHLLGKQGFDGHHKAWIHPDPDRVNTWRERLRAKFGQRKVVGFSWRSLGRDLHQGFAKDLPLLSLNPLLANLPNVAFFCVQHGRTPDDAQQLERCGLLDAVDPALRPTEDIDDLAACLAALDLLVSTSNTNVHMAGAMGVPTWLVLGPRQPPLWYWGYRGDRSPWYPSLRIFRPAQGATADAVIDEVIASVRDALEKRYR